jgi:hypothetical protein
VDDALYQHIRHGLVAICMPLRTIQVELSNHNRNRKEAVAQVHLQHRRVRHEQIKVEGASLNPKKTARLGEATSWMCLRSL